MNINARRVTWKESNQAAKGQLGRGGDGAKCKGGSPFTLLHIIHCWHFYKQVTYVIIYKEREKVNYEACEQALYNKLNAPHYKREVTKVTSGSKVLQILTS